MTDMPIAEQLVLLAELANVDGKHKLISDKLETVPAVAKKADETAAALKKQLDDLSVKKEAADKAKKQIENEIVDEKLKIKKWEARAHEIRGEREHAALVSEISTAKRVIHRLEDTQLEQMEVLEATAKETATVEAKHKKAAEDAAAEWKRVEGDLKTLRGEGEQVNQARQALLKKLPASVVKRYDTVAAKRQGVGVSIIKGEVCTMCKRTLPPQLCIQVRKGVVLEQCPSCSRFLVHEDITKVQPNA